MIFVGPDSAVVCGCGECICVCFDPIGGAEDGWRVEGEVVLEMFGGECFVLDEVIEPFLCGVSG